MSASFLRTAARAATVSRPAVRQPRVALAVAARVPLASRQFSCSPAVWRGALPAGWKNSNPVTYNELKPLTEQPSDVGVAWIRL